MGERSVGEDGEVDGWAWALVTAEQADEEQAKAGPSEESQQPCEDLGPESRQPQPCSGRYAGSSSERARVSQETSPRVVVLDRWLRTSVSVFEGYGCQLLVFGSGGHCPTA